MSFLYFNASNVPNNTPFEICAEVLRSTPHFVSPSQSYAVFVIVFTCLYQLYWFATIAAFYYLQRYHVELRTQRMPLIILQGMWAVVLLIVGPLRDVTGRDHWDCDVYLWLRCSLTFITSVAVTLRLYDLYARMKLHELVAKARLDTLYKMRGGGGGNEADVIEQGVDREERQASEKSSMTHTSVEVGATPAELQRRMYLSSVRFYITLSLTCIVPAVLVTCVVYAIYPYYGKGCTGCQLGPVEYILSAFSGWLVGPVMMKVILYFRTKRETARIMREFVYAIGCASLAYPFIVLLCADPWLQLTVTGIISWEWFCFLALHSLHFFPVTLPLIRIFLHRNALIDKSAGATQDMLYLIDTREGIQSFKQHLVSEYSVENLKFYEEVSIFKAGYGNLSSEQRVEVARTIYESFISDTAFLQINVSSDLRRKLGLLFHPDSPRQQDLSISVNVFDSAENEVLGMLRDGFLRYQRGPLYRKFMGASGAAVAPVGMSSVRM